MFDRLGDVQTSGMGEQGLFYDGMRYLSEFSREFVERAADIAQFHSRHEQFPIHRGRGEPRRIPARVVAIHRGVLHLVRSRFLWRDSCFEQLHFVNHGLDELEIPSRIRFDADYADIFEIRGTVREKRGRRLPARLTTVRLCWDMRGWTGCRSRNPDRNAT